MRQAQLVPVFCGQECGTLDGISFRTQGFSEFLQEEPYVVFRRQRTHHADAENLSCQRPKATGNLNTRAIQKPLADFRFVYARRNDHGVESRNTVFRWHMHAQSQGFHFADEESVTTAMAVPAILDAFLSDDLQGFPQCVEHGNGSGVMLTMRYGGVVVNKFDIQIPTA